jgi:hypothetical protein
MLECKRQTGPRLSRRGLVYTLPLEFSVQKSPQTLYISTLNQESAITWARASQKAWSAMRRVRRCTAAAAPAGSAASSSALGGRSCARQHILCTYIYKHICMFTNHYEFTAAQS